MNGVTNLSFRLRFLYCKNMVLSIKRFIFLQLDIGD